MGETAVGGSRTNAGERFGTSEEGRKVGKERIANVAKALAFIVARGSLDLSIFKVGSPMIYNIQLEVDRLTSSRLSILPPYVQTLSSSSLHS